MLQRIITWMIFCSFLFSSFVEGVIARDEIHTLDDLPFGEQTLESIPTATHFLYDSPENIRANMLDNLDVIDSHHQKKPEKITLSLTWSEEIRVLLAEKKTLENVATGQFVLVPSFFWGSLTSADSSRSISSPSDLLQDIFGKSDFWKKSVGDSIIPSTDTPKMYDPSIFSPGREIHISEKMREKWNVSTTKWAIAVDLPAGLTMRDASGSIIDPKILTLEALNPLKKSKAQRLYDTKNKNRGNAKKGFSKSSPEWFDFGIPGKHLIFSFPVKITIDASHMSDGMALDLMTLHAWDTDFHTIWLSVDPSTGCNADGSATIPWSTVRVKNGKVVFYTCGASSFTMNPNGGLAGSNDIRLIIGDCAQVQLYYNNLQQLYTGNPPTTGCSGPSAWPTLRVGNTTYGNSFTAWSTATTTGSSINNNYAATSTMTAVSGGRTYTVIIDWNYIAPNKYLTWSWRVIVPAGNTQNVRFYYGMDSYVAWGDTNDVGYYTMTGGQTVWVFDNTANILSAFRFVSGVPWTAYQANGYNTVRTKIANGANFTNNIQTTGGDLWYGINWDFGTTAGTYSWVTEWRLTPYVSGDMVDIVPGIWQPEWPLTTNMLSQVPITVTNVGTLASTGVHTIIFTVPTNLTWPSSPFTDNGWSCGAQIGTGVTCTKTTSIAENLGVETFSIPVTPTTAASGTTVTFFARLTNTSDSNTANNLATTTNAVVWWAPAVDPGWVTGENLWLQANNNRTNCTTQGCSVTTWTNIGWLGTAANAVLWLGTVTYDANTLINFNPTVYFNNASLNTNNTLGVAWRPVSIFAVTKIGAGWSFDLWPQTAVNNGMEWSTSPTLDRWKRYNSTLFYNWANGRSASVPAITTTIRNGTSGVSDNYTDDQAFLNSTSNQNFTATNIGIGRVVNTNSTLANVAEVIVYPLALTATQKNQVESYLAIKYGITIDQTTATDYVLSNLATVWNTSVAWVYKNNITGIARDDNTSLNQTKSRSINDTGDITVSKTLIPSNHLALMWAHDGGQNSTFTGTDAPIGYERIGREWLFQERNGDMGTVTISYPATSVPSGFTGTLMMLQDSDPTFTTGATAYTGTLSGGNWNFTANIASMQYMTFAKSVPVDTTAPVITSVSIASGALIPKWNFSLTIAYSDTGVGIAPPSFTGKIYGWDATGMTWDAVNLASDYMSVISSSTTTGVLQVTGLPYGKYRFDISVADTLGNIQTQTYTYYVDAAEWTLSAPNYDIGNALLSQDTFGSGELILTVKTVWAGFDLTMIRTTDLTYISDIIPVFSWSTGWWYDKNIWSGYTGAITPHGTTQALISVPKNINTNGQKNTFTYRVKYGVNPPANVPAGDYVGNVRFGINLVY